jgi:hypothetical protein
MMSDQAIDPVELAEEHKMTAKQAEDYAKSGQYARSRGGAIDAGIGNMGGAGASGSMGPDLAKSNPLPGNSSDLPSR